jgi:hypothetical protein
MASIKTRPCVVRMNISLIRSNKLLYPRLGGGSLPPQVFFGLPLAFQGLFRLNRNKVFENSGLKLNSPEFKSTAADVFTTPAP